MGSVAEIILPLALAFMMFTLGLGLGVSDFTRIATRPRDILIGLFLQIGLLPVVGLVLIAVWPLSPEIAIGVMLIAVAPGGVTSNYLTALARGDIALSVSMTAVASILSVLTIPLILSYVLADGLPEGVTFTKTALSIFMIVTLPVMSGMAFRKFAQPIVEKMERSAHMVSTVLLVLVLVGAVVQQRENVVSYFAEAGAVTFALNVIMMVLAYSTAKALSTGPRQQISMCMECGLQNGTLAIAIGVMLFGGGAYLIPAATYSLIMFGTSVVFLALARTKLVKVEPESRRA